MSNVQLDTSQLINGAAILLSFYVGFKYGVRVQNKKHVESDTNKATTSSETEKRVELPKTFSDSGEYKMVLVVRNDLKMGKGKIAAQCGHAAVGAYQSALKKNPALLREWEYSGSAKIAVKVESKEQLFSIKKEAQAQQLNTCMIRDAGRTQIEPNTITVLAIGPADKFVLDSVTGHLKLL